MTSLNTRSSHYIAYKRLSVTECECYDVGTQICNVQNGDCYCKMNYTGHLCNECSEGYFDSTNGHPADNPTCIG